MINDMMVSISFVNLCVLKNCKKKTFSWKSLSRLLGVIQPFLRNHNLE